MEVIDAYPTGQEIRVGEYWSYLQLRTLSSAFNTYSYIPAVTTMIFIKNFNKLPLLAQHNLRTFVTSNLSPLHPYFLTGFSDAECCFGLKIRKNNKYKTGWRVEPWFQIGLHEKDRALLELIQSSLGGIGTIYKHGKESIQYRVSSDKEFIRVIIRQIKAGINRGRSFEGSETFEVAINPTQKNKTTSTLIHKRGLHTNALFSNIRGESSLNRPISQPLCSLVKRELSGDYIAGFVQADGSFSAVLTRKTRGEKEYFNISLVFTIVQSQKYKDLILEIQKKFGDIGHWYLNKKEKSIRYQVTNQSDLLNVIIPFFMKHQLRGEKLLSFLRFKYLLEVSSTKLHLKDKNIFLSLIVIAGQLNDRDKLGNKIRYLKPEEQRYVINNIIPEGVDISKLKDSIANFKLNSLTLDFVHGLFESNTNNFRNVSKEDQDYIRNNFLPKGLELWRFKEYCLSLNNKSTFDNEKLKVFGQNLRSYSTIATPPVSKAEAGVTPWFLTGFADGEGSFMIKTRKSSKYRLGWTVEPVFQIKLHGRDKELLISLQIYLGGAGTITRGGKDSAVYMVRSLKQISNVIIPHFDKYPLITQKLGDYLIFKEVIGIIQRKEHLTREGLDKVIALKANLNLGLSDELKAAFPNIIPVKRPLTINQVVPDPNWVAGFTSGEGCFYVVIKKSNTHNLEAQVSLRFSISQHSRDEVLMRSLVNYFGIGRYVPASSNKDLGNFEVIKLSDNMDKIIPFFVRYPILGMKSQDFKDFCQVVQLMSNGAHLTEDGLAEIREIKAGMNRGREIE